MNELRNQVNEFEVIDHGIEASDYFQGCGIAFTEFTDVATGCGNDFAEALDDALECLAQHCTPDSNGWELEGIEARILAEYFPGKRKFPTKPCVTAKHGDDCYYYVSVRVR